MIEMQQDLNTPLIALLVEQEGGKKLFWKDERDDHDYMKLRQTEIQIFSPESIPSPNNYLAVYDMRSLT